jgi:hypothetical protein
VERSQIGVTLGEIPEPLINADASRKIVPSLVEIAKDGVVASQVIEVSALFLQRWRPFAQNISRAIRVAKLVQTEG